MAKKPGKVEQVPIAEQGEEPKQEKPVVEKVVKIQIPDKTVKGQLIKGRTIEYTVKQLSDGLKAVIEKAKKHLQSLTLDEQLIYRRYILESRLSRMNDLHTPNVIPKETLQATLMELKVMNDRPSEWKRIVKVQGRWAPPRKMTAFEQFMQS